MSYNSSSARELYIPQREREIIQQEQPKPTRLKVVERSTRVETRASLVSFRTVLMFVSIISCICVMLYNQAKLNEINNEISQTRNGITQLESEYVRMQSGLESTMSLRNIERMAEQELGLQQVNQYQVQYVRIYEEDRIEVAEQSQSNSFSEQVETFAATIVQQIQGFFGGSVD